MCHALRLSSAYCFMSIKCVLVALMVMALDALQSIGHTCTLRQTAAMTKTSPEVFELRAARDAHIKALVEEGELTVADVASKFGLSKGLVYGVLDQRK